MTATSDMVDTIGSTLNRIIGLRYWEDRLIASYTTGSPDIAASDGQFAQIRHAVKIDQRPTNELARGAIVKDIESGGAHIENAVNIARTGVKFTTYLPQLQNGFSLNECRAAMARGGVRNMTYWVANFGWNRDQALRFLLANPDVVAVQWAAPETNANTPLPGSNLTLGQANADLSVTRADWPSSLRPPPEHPAEGIWKAQLIWVPAFNKWLIHRVPGDHVKMASKRHVHRVRVTLNDHSGHWVLGGVPTETAPGTKRARGLWRAELHFDPAHERYAIYPLRSVVGKASTRTVRAAEVAVNDQDGHWTISRVDPPPAPKPKPPVPKPPTGVLPGHPEVKPGVARVVNEILAQFPKLVVTSTTGGTHAPGSLHFQGRAVDLGTIPFDQGLQDRAGAWTALHLAQQLTEGIHNPADGSMRRLSVKFGIERDPSFWGADTWAQHRGHIHVAV